MAKVLVIGGGAAGLLAAGTAAQRGHEVTILERNERPARKVMITGKGRCNLTNHCTLINELVAQVPTNGRFLHGAFSRFMPQDIMALVEAEGVELKIERGNRVFPVSDKAVDIVDALVRFATKNGAKLRQGRATALLLEDGAVKGVKTEDGDTIFADRVIVATGGMSYPLTGSTGDGYLFAKQAGHTIVPLKPSLVPLESSDTDCKSMQGLSLKNVSLKIIDNNSNKEIYSDFGEMLFTHFGISGPMVLSASSHIREMPPNRYRAVIDLKPALTEEQLDKRLQKEFQQNANRDVSNAFSGLLPRKIIVPVLKRWGVPFDKKCNVITREERHALCTLLKGFTIPLNGFRPIEEAIITSGGVNTAELNPKTMESKLISGLYFAGEVIDCDAYTGGFNLQIAWCTGRLAGENAAYL